MKITADHDLTDYHAADWEITLTINPDSETAHLAWSPTELHDPGIIHMHITRRPISKTKIEQISAAVRRYEHLQDILDVEWVYLHNQNRWGWNGGEAFEEAVSELRELLREMA